LHFLRLAAKINATEGAAWVAASQQGLATGRTDKYKPIQFKKYFHSGLIPCFRASVATKNLLT
jgi:hypothetical protein